MRSWIFLAALLAGGAAVAQTPPTPPVVSAVWARASTPHAAAAAVYLTIAGAEAPDRLTGAATPVAADATLHESRMVGGVMQMRPVGPLPVAPGKTVSLAPGGLHLMLTGLRAPLLPGQHFPLTLRFEKAGEVTADVTVEKIGALGPGNTSGGDMPAGMKMGP